MTNHELARAAAEYAVGRIIMFDALRDLDTPGKQECATKHIEKAIADTYAEAMAELDRLRATMNRVEVTPLGYCPHCSKSDGTHSKKCQRKKPLEVTK